MQQFENIGERIRLLRLEAGMTQEQLAEAADLTPQFVGQLERGNRMPRLDSLARLAHVFGVSPVQMLQGEDEEAGIIALLEDCSAAERSVILEAAKAVKTSLRKNFQEE